MRLAKLPDRTRVKMNLVLSPGLAKRLQEYADFYAETYGSREEVADLIPFMLEALLDGDADFRRASRACGEKELSTREHRKQAIGGTRKSQRQGAGNVNGS